MERHIAMSMTIVALQHGPVATLTQVRFQGTAGHFDEREKGTCHPCGFAFNFTVRQ
jgi:hypothetical protein